MKTINNDRLLLTLIAIRKSIEAIAKRTKEVQLLRKLIELSCSDYGGSRFKTIL